MRSGVRLGLDWGDARIGVAGCDPSGMMAFPLATVAAGPGAIGDLIGLIGEHDPIEVVVGLPRSLSGGEGPAAVKVRAAVAELAAAMARSGLRVGIRLVDERLTTVSASRRLSAGGKKVKQQRSVIDQAAAAEILQHALDRERASGSVPGELVSGELEPGTTGETDT